MKMPNLNSTFDAECILREFEEVADGSSLNVSVSLVRLLQVCLHRPHQRRLHRLFPSAHNRRGRRPARRFLLPSRPACARRCAIGSLAERRAFGSVVGGEGEGGEEGDG